MGLIAFDVMEYVFDGRAGLVLLEVLGIQSICADIQCDCFQSRSREGATVILTGVSIPKRVIMCSRSLK
jgi:hypothetical protein